jgi:hypothetical protein
MQRKKKWDNVGYVLYSLEVFCVRFWEIFWNMVSTDGFLFLVKELGLLTNPGYWIKVLDAVRSYMYILL